MRVEFHSWVHHLSTYALPHSLLSPAPEDPRLKEKSLPQVPNEQSLCDQLKRKAGQIYCSHCLRQSYQPGLSRGSPLECANSPCTAKCGILGVAS